MTFFPSQSNSAKSAQEFFTRAAERQEMRKQQLKNYCQQHAGQEPWHKKHQFERFIIDDKNTYIYCSVPKVASTPLRMTLMRLRNDSKVKITESSVHIPTFWKHLSEYNATEISNRQATHFKFLFVREPFHRLLSGYKDKFFGKNRVYTDGFRKRIVRAFRPHEEEVLGAETNNVTFTEFLKFVVWNNNSMAGDVHWRQIEKLCFPCAFDFDFIGHFETLAEDAAYFMRKARLDDHVTFPPVRASKASSDFLAYYSQVPREVIYRLGEAFRSDFEMFGYPFPGPLKSLL